MKKPVILSLISLLLMACNSTSTVKENTLKLTSWQLIKVDNTDVSTKRINVKFLEAMRVTGFAGCNRFFGEGRISQSQLFVSNLGRTRKLCADDDNTLERSLLNQLEIGAPAQLSRTTLVLDGTPRFTFIRVQ